MLEGVAQRWRSLSLLTVVVLWVLAWALFRDHHTLVLDGSAQTPVFDWLGDRSDWVEKSAASGSNPLINFAGTLADVVNEVFSWLQGMFTVAQFPRPLPQFGWLGIIAVAAMVTYVAAGWRTVALVVPSFLAFGVLGYWADAIDLLLVTFFAVVVSCVFGILLGVVMAHSRWFSALLTPVLDVMQTMPSFVYLLPMSILFGIGPAAAILMTLIYAAPPVIRITAHGIRSVSPTVLEATDSLGHSRTQRLWNVELPMAKRTIIAGINQTMMAALSMATIAAYIDSPGLGQPVLDGLKRGQLGTSFVAGMAIVIMAVMLDRTMTAAGFRAELAARSGRTGGPFRRVGLGVGGIATLVALYLSHNYVWANEFPSRPDLGTPLRDAVDRFGDWLRSDLSGVTSGLQRGFTSHVLNPIQSVIADSPWYVTALAILVIAALVGGRKAAAATVLCLGLILGLGLWNHAMETLTACLVATIVVVALAVAFGVWMGRSHRVDVLLRPLLDMGQTLPPFVYLVPILILFGPNRFTAMLAGVVYAAPVAIKLVADGVRAVSPNTIEAAEAAGSSTWQMITRVQLPMARSSVLLAANQGLLYVLSMVVIGAVAGAGALGFDVVTGFRQLTDVGRGLAAGTTIVLIGILLDRITTYGAERAQNTQTASRARS
ncbi:MULTISPECIES: ABC transporter permease [unclassified Nocardioides]|uniref:ABC transporter permease n=1 Tax=unclassified Nocardioides TaxID=2615069 RepID=UPI0006F26ACF|nr:MULTISPECIES: ABC transporter permease subunit [unclassified Nocardioides]KRA37842.1 ABC transporter permease [Nocardioides sp. Root614]KRA91802.1 ABC transporter permease [Nocardioides sp. Root682]